MYSHHTQICPLVVNEVSLRSRLDKELLPNDSKSQFQGLTLRRTLLPLVKLSLNIVTNLTGPDITVLLDMLYNHDERLQGCCSPVGTLVPGFLGVPGWSCGLLNQGVTCSELRFS